MPRVAGRPAGGAGTLLLASYGVRLLVLGGLGVYPERLRALVAQGHRLWYASTLGFPKGQGPIPGLTSFPLFERAGGNPGAWLAALIASERIEAVYSLLNVWDGSNAATAALLRHGCPVPLVRHYKEHYLAPSEDERVCLEQSDGVIFLNEESRAYFAGVYRVPRRTACLDADLLPRCYLAGSLRPKLSAADGRPHLLIAGSVTDDGGRYDYRELIRQLASHRAHVHLYGLFRRLYPAEGWLLPSDEVKGLYRELASTSPYLHVHEPVPPARFVEEWSPYDAGLLHAPDARDRFQPFNFPNRYTAYLAAGVPVALAAGAMPAMQRHLEGIAPALVYGDPADLVRRLPDPVAPARALAAREDVTFEAICPHLIHFIHSCAGPPLQGEWESHATTDP